MSRFAQFLLKKQLLMPEQLEQALQHQAVYGARLGTNLVELRILTIERLAECLAEFHRVPLPPRAWIERPKRNAIEKVTRPLVERIRFIPMRLEANNILHAAVLDPNDPATLDDLRFATGCKIHPYVLPEIWMHDWLFTLFKLPRGIRHIDPDADADKELEKPAQAYDFQAAQAAIAAKANRIMVPVVGVSEGKDSRPPDRKTTLQGIDRAAVLAEARAAGSPADRNSVAGDGPLRPLVERTTFSGVPADRIAAQAAKPAPISERVTGQGAERAAGPVVRTTGQGAERAVGPVVRTTGQGAERAAGPLVRPAGQGADRVAAVPPRPTMLGADRAAAVPARPTMLGADRASMVPGRSPLQAADRPAGAPVRPTLQGGERLAALGARTSVQGTERQTAFPERTAAQGSERQTAAPATISDKVVDPVKPASTGASVRPPPISMKSLTDLGGRASLPNAPGIPNAGLIAQASELPSLWGPEAPTTPRIPRLLEALPPPVRRDPTVPPPPPPPPPPPSPPPRAAAPASELSAPAPRSVELSDLEQSLRQVVDREQLIDITFSIASRFARVVALFMVHRGMVQGVRVLEDGVSRAINGVLLPLESASMLARAANQFVPFRIDPRDKPMDARVQQLLTQQPPGEVSLFPVVVKQRAVNLLYASHGSEPLGPIAFGALSTLAEQMGTAYGQLILNRKGGS